MLNQARLLLFHDSLLGGSLAGVASVATAVTVCHEEGLTADALAPETDHESANNHTDTAIVSLRTALSKMEK